MENFKIGFTDRQSAAKARRDYPWESLHEFPDRPGTWQVACWGGKLGDHGLDVWFKQVVWWKVGTENINQP